MGILLGPWRVSSVGEGWRESGRDGERWDRWRMEERRWVGEDVIERKESAWEAVGETERGRRDRSERR